jgi:putative ABC transport system permease protein
MLWIRYLYTRLYGLFRKDRIEDDMDDELRFYVHMRTQEYMQAGMSAEQARLQALASFGPIAYVKDRCRDIRGGGIMETLVQDLRFGVRMLLKSPGFTITALVTLALGIGANTAIFSLIYGVLLRPLPYKDGKQLVALHQKAIVPQTVDLGFSVSEIFDYRDQNQTLDAVVEHHSMYFVLYGGEEPLRVQTGVVSANFFDVLGVKPILGRTFLPDDEKAGVEAVLILSNKFWKESQGGDPNIIGKVFQMNNRPHTVIGVLPDIPQFPWTDVYMPTNQCPFRSSPEMIRDRDMRMMTAFGRLRPNVKLAQAQADLDRIADNLRRAYPASYPKDSGYAASAALLQDELTHEARPTFLLLLAMAGLVLLIASANVANLCLARLTSRSREIAVRTALGASRPRLMQQLLTESTFLALIGGTLGLVIAKLGLPLLVKFAEMFTTRTTEIKIDTSVLLFTMIVSVGTGVLFGLIPALFGQERRRKGLAGALKEGTSRGSSGRRHRARGVLVVAQVALSFILLVGAGLMIRSFIKLQQVNPGFDPDKVLVLRLAPSFTKYTTNDQYNGLFDRFMDSVKRVPGVQVAALGSGYPLNPVAIKAGPNTVGIQLEGHPIPEGQTPPQIDPHTVTPDYFNVIGTPLITGRAFTDSDNQKAPSVAIVNQSAASHRWADEDPIGRRLTLDNGKTWTTIVGIVGDVKQYGLDHPAVDEIYLPVAQSPNAGFLLVKTFAEPTALSGSLRSALHDVDPQMAVDRIQTLQAVRASSIASPKLTAVLLSLFAGLAVLITAAGIAGVIALSVSQRTSEIGIRMALGASRNRVLGMVVSQGMLLILVGLATGVAGALLLTKLMAGLLFSVPATDLTTFLMVSLSLSGVAALACFIPARRVTSIDPINALRSE